MLAVAGAAARISRNRTLIFMCYRRARQMQGTKSSEQYTKRDLLVLVNIRVRMLNGRRNVEH